MSDSTPRLALPEIAQMQEMTEVSWNETLVQLDAFVDLYLLGLFVDTPPSSPNDGDTYVVGSAPTGAWSGYAYKLAYCIDGAWNFYAPCNGLRGYNNADGKFYVYVSGTWTDWNSLISASEASVASASTCDLGAAGSLFVAITGTTAITSFGTQTNKLRFVRFAGALTLTYNATSLILLGGASRTTAAGDVGIYVSDGSGNWRERAYVRADRDPGDAATRSGTETLSNKTISGGANTLSNIPNAALSNSSLTLNGYALSLGGSLSLAASDVSALALSGGTLTGALQAPNIGVNAAPDTTNKLSVASSAILFDNIGTDCRIYLNKAASANTASTLYEDNFSGRAEVGLCGDDNFHFKVSPNASAWYDALDITAASGLVTANYGLALSGSTSGATTLVASASASGTLTLPAATDTLVGQATTDTLFNKTIDTSINVIRYNAVTNGANINVEHARGTSGSPTPLLSGDQLGYLAMSGYDGSVFAQGARIAGTAVENWSTSAHGSEMLFYTTPAGSGGDGVARLTLDPNGNLFPFADNAVTLGASSNRWSVVYSATGTINTSGAATKTGTRALDAAEIAAAKTLAANLRVFQFVDAVAKKGADKARWHAGMIYEEVVAAFEAQGLDPMRYGIVCRDADPSNPGEFILGLRYDELAQFVMAGLHARLCALEAKAG
jgi:hypothetical protein